MPILRTATPAFEDRFELVVSPRLVDEVVLTLASPTLSPVLSPRAFLSLLEA